MNSPTGSGRVPVVEEQRDPPEQVVAGDQQAAVGLVEARRARARGPGVSITCQAPRSVSTSTPGTQLAVGRDRAHDPGALAAARLLVELERPPPARRSGARPRSAGRACASGSSIIARDVLPGRVHPQLAAGAVDDRRRRARSGRCGRGCRRPAARPRAGSRPAPARSSSWRWPSSVAIPVSKRTIPSPARTANAFTCGTPGQGSGRRSRQTPGRTRSPRPSSRLRLDWPIAGMLARRDRSRIRSRVPGDPAANAALINRFYEAFARRTRDDGRLLRARRPLLTTRCSRTCTATRSAAMWRMLCEPRHRPEDRPLRRSTPTPTRGSAHWDADYTFSAPGAHVTTRSTPASASRTG